MLLMHQNTSVQHLFYPGRTSFKVCPLAVLEPLDLKTLEVNCPDTFMSLPLHLMRLLMIELIQKENSVIVFSPSCHVGVLQHVPKQLKQMRTCFKTKTQPKWKHKMVPWSLSDVIEVPAGPRSQTDHWDAFLHRPTDVGAQTWPPIKGLNNIIYWINEESGDFRRPGLCRTSCVEPFNVCLGRIIQHCLAVKFQKCFAGCKISLTFH